MDMHGIFMHCFKDKRELMEQLTSTEDKAVCRYSPCGWGASLENVR